jgi:transcriptional regulator GlxA family with amidase domain
VPDFAIVDEFHDDAKGAAYLDTFVDPGPPFDPSVGPSDVWFRRVIDHIETHLGEDIGTAALAALVGLSPRHLARLFLADLGVTPGRFVRQARTEAAAQLVSTTSLPLPSVAARCGFGSVETLRLAFTQRYGTSPSQFRARHGVPAGA